LAKNWVVGDLANNDAALGAEEIKDKAEALRIDGTIALETTAWSRIYEFLKLDFVL